MSWKDKIPGTFGVADKKFAGHPCDSERAAEMLKIAIKEGVGYSDYLEGIEDWLKSQGCIQEHIDQEVIKVKNVSSYLQHD
jgi:hypothetical protein